MLHFVSTFTKHSEILSSQGAEDQNKSTLYFTAHSNLHATTLLLVKHYFF